MKMKSITFKKHFIVLAVMLATSLTAWADNVVSGDYVKDNVKYFRWYFHKDVGVLELAKPDGFTGEIPYIVYDQTPFYSYWAQIKKVFVRDGITKIPKSMFSLNDYGSTHYTNLEELDCSDAAATLTTIDEQAFKYCAGLKTVRLPYGVTIGISAFEDCTSLTTVILSGDKTTETTIGATAFKGCTSLESVSFDSGKTVKIETSAFTNCTGLKTVYTGGANVTVGASAFSGSGLETFCNSSSALYVTNLTLADGAFGGASKLKVFSISSSSDITIPYHAFQNCTSLENFVTWGGKVTVGNGAFEGCTSLKNIYSDTFGFTNITSVGSQAFSGCTSLESFTASADLTSIGTYAFKNCTGMKYVDLRNANAETLKLGDLRTDGTIYRSDSWCATTSVNAFIYAPSNLPASKAHGDNIVTTGTGDDAGKLFCNGPCFYENSPVGFPSDGKFYSTNTVAYWRTFTAGQYYTICLPYAMKNAKLKYYTLKKVDGNTIEFDEVEHSNVEANKPYVVYAKETLETLTIGSSTSRIEVGASGSPSSVSANGYTLWGNFERTIDADYVKGRNDKDYYVLQNDGTWKLFDGSNADVKIPPFRAYILVDKNAGAPVMLASDFGGGSTGIGDLTPSLSEGEGTWYDLQGRRIEGRPMQKGVYIVGGKKIIVK